MAAGLPKSHRYLMAVGPVVLAVAMVVAPGGAVLGFDAVAVAGERSTASTTGPPRIGEEVDQGGGLGSHDSAGMLYSADGMTEKREVAVSDGCSRRTASPLMIRMPHQKADVDRQQKAEAPAPASAAGFAAARMAWTGLLLSSPGLLMAWWRHM